MRAGSIFYWEESNINLSYDGGGGALCAPKVFLFFYSKSLPQTKPLDPPVNS